MALFKRSSDSFLLYFVGEKMNFFRNIFCGRGNDSF
jgi:hypothetical protein